MPSSQEQARQLPDLALSNSKEAFHAARSGVFSNSKCGHT
jgi:hypothetical protein